MSYVLKETKSINSHNTHIEKKESVEKRAIIFLFRIFKKKDLVVLPSTTNITILEIPPHLTPPSFLGHAYQATPKKLPKQTQRSICKCQK